MAPCKERNQLGALTQPRSPLLALNPLVPVNADVAGLPADGDDVRSAVAVEIADGQGFHGHPAVFDNVTGPARAFLIERLIDAHAAPLAGFITEIITDAGDDFLLVIIVKIAAL